MIFSAEDAYRLPGLEDALTRDLRMAVMEAVDKAVFKGDSGADGTDADISGLQTLAGTEKTLTQANKVKADHVLKAFLELVDGKHASTMAEVRVVSSVGSNVLWGTTVLPSPATTGETIGQFLMRSGMAWRTREGIDSNTAANDFGAYIGLQRGIAGAGVAAVWSAGELIRDPYQGAAKGEVHLTFAHYWDFALPRFQQLRAAEIRRIGPCPLSRSSARPARENLKSSRTCADRGKSCWTTPACMRPSGASSETPPAVTPFAWTGIPLSVWSRRSRTSPWSKPSTASWTGTLPAQAATTWNGSNRSPGKRPSSWTLAKKSQRRVWRTR